MSDEDARLEVVRLLQRKGFRVRDLGGGSGVPKFSRVEISDDKQKFSCSVKTTSSGRISYTRNDDGTHKVLSGVDRVIHVMKLPGTGNVVKVTMFDAAIVVRAFEYNHAEKAKRNMEHIPSWVNPEYEAGWRLTGSGFQTDAIWSETIDRTVEPVRTDNKGTENIAEHVEVKTETASQVQTGIMDRIRAMLSEHMGVKPELIDIDVRVRI